MRKGIKSAAQTKAPLKDRIIGSKVNKEGSASSRAKASAIVLSDEIISSLSEKVQEFNGKNPNNKVTLNDLKAVFRRGAGAFSVSHRPNMTRNGWAYARVNKFLEKKSGKKVKDSYIQDDDLMEKGGLVAPNGKKSNLTETQYKLVRTPEFKAWFGDWENDPQNASKVVDENGEPLVVYHGTNVEFYKFDLKYFGKTDSGWYGKGFYFTPQKNFSFAKDAVEEFGGNEITLKVFLNIKNPLYGQAYAEQKSNLVGSAKDRDKDGVIIRYDYGHEKEGQIPEIIVWNSNQIKLADGTNTTFDSNSDDIRYENGGLIAPNGNKSNLTEEQYKLVRTPQFKAWFGDWENDPQNASKVVDENGEPLVVYRGFNKKSDKGFTFKYNVNRFKNNRKTNKFGHYFTISEIVAKEYAEQGEKENDDDIIIKSYFLNIKSLLDITKKNKRFPNFQEWAIEREKGMMYSNYKLVERLKKREIPLSSYLLYDADLEVKDKNNLDELSDAKIKILEKKIAEQEEDLMELYNSSEAISLPALIHIVTGESKELIDERIKSLQDIFSERDEAYVNRDVYEWFIKYKHPLVIENLDDYLKKLIIDYGYDGVKFVEHMIGSIRGKTDTVYVTFESNQIKLADGTNTTFDSNSDDIRYEKGGLIDDNGLMDSVFPEIKGAFKKNGLKLEPSYIFSDGSNKSYLPHFGVYKTDGNVEKVGITYYADGYEVLGEVEVEVKDNGNIEVEIEFPTWQVKEELSIYARGGHIDQMHKKIKEDLLNNSFKSHKDIEKIAQEKDVELDYAKEQLKKGMKVESEHSNDPMVQEIIALQHLDEMIDYYEKLEFMEVALFKDGGQIDPDNKKTKDMITHKSGNAGGLLVGNRHSEGGIKAINKSTDAPLEMEGGEVVITRNAVSDEQKREFEGEMLTNREILSKINEGGGGVSFEEGGEVNYDCDCDDEMAKGGETLSSTEKLISYLKGNGELNKGTESIAKDGTKYRYDRYSTKGESATNSLVSLFEKAAQENGNRYATKFNYKDIYSIAYDRPRYKGVVNGKISMTELVEGDEMAKGGESKKMYVVFFSRMLNGKSVPRIYEMYYTKEEAEKYVESRKQLGESGWKIKEAKDMPIYSMINIVNQTKNMELSNFLHSKEKVDVFFNGKDSFYKKDHSWVKPYGYTWENWKLVSTNKMADGGETEKFKVQRTKSYDDRELISILEYIPNEREYVNIFSLNDKDRQKAVKNNYDLSNDDNVINFYKKVEKGYLADGGELDCHSELKQFLQEQNSPIIVEEPIIEEIVIEEEVIELPQEIMLFKEDLVLQDDSPMIYVGSSIYANNTNGADEWVVKSFTSDGLNLTHIPTSPLSHKHDDKYLSFDELKTLFNNKAISIKYVLNERELNLILMILKDKLANKTSFKDGGIVFADKNASKDEEIMESQFGNKKF